MPKSKGRRKPSGPKPAPTPRKRLTPIEIPVPPEERKFDRSDPSREIPEAKRHKLAPLPEPATRDQLLVALSQLDPLTQEMMIAARLAAMPHPGGGDAVNINRNLRGPWAHHLRKLGLFCIPELATHELVAPDGTGMMINHTASTLESIDRKGLWEAAKTANPSLAQLVDNADTPEKKRRAMAVLAAKLPVEHRIALEKLIAATPEELEFT